MSIEEGFKPSAHYDTERVKGTWVLKVLAWMHLCLWSVIKKWKNKWNYSDNKNLFKISKLKKRRSLVLHCHVICLTLNSLFFFAGNSCFHFAIHVSSRTVTLLCSQDFCLCYQVPQSVSHYAICNTCVCKKNLHH